MNSLVLVVGLFWTNFLFAGAFLPYRPRTLKVQSPRVALGSLGSATEHSPPHRDIALVGFLSKEKDQNLGQIFQTIYEKKLAASMRCITDSEQFARRRLISPKTVYSGLIGSIRFMEVPTINDLATIESSASGADAIVVHNVQLADIKQYIDMIKRLQVKRAVIAVNVTGRESDNEITNSYVESLFRGNQVDSSVEPKQPIYTVIKYSEPVIFEEESRRPFRIVVDTTPVPTVPSSRLATGDLLRVLTECIDLPKAFNRVYGLGPGNALDNEILVWMKAQGISTSDRVAVLLSDFQEVSERRLKEMNTEFKANKNRAGVTADPF